MAETIDSLFARQKKWGRLTALRFARSTTFPSGQSKKVWLFSCECGSEKEINAHDVRNGKILSCGCLSHELKSAPKTHGNAKHGQFPGAYKSWRNMLTRGRNPNINRADRYVLRGITISPEWLPGGDGLGFVRFLEHIGDRPTDKHSLDRIDNDRGYEPGNVQWVLFSEQANNTSRNRKVQFGNKLLTISQAAEASGVKPAVIRDRLRLGWPEADLFAPRARSEFGKGPRSRPGVKPR